MSIELHKAQVFEVVNWPVLALAAPISGVVAGVILANVAYRLWSAGLVNAAVVGIVTVVSMLLVGLLVWNLPKGQVRLEQSSVVLDRLLFLDRRAQSALATLTLVRWFPDRTQTPRGVQLWVNDGNSLVKIAAASQAVLDDFEQRSPRVLTADTTGMPHAQLSPDEFTRLVELLVLQGSQLQEVTNGAD